MDNIKINDKIVLKWGPFKGEEATVIDIVPGALVTKVLVKLNNGLIVYEAKSQIERKRTEQL